LSATVACPIGGPLAIPVGLGVGLLVGLVNGIGVAYLRVPSMIFTLGVNAVMRGLMVAHTGGYAPQTAATELMRTLASEHTLGIPNALFVWASVSVLAATLAGVLLAGYSTKAYQAMGDVYLLPSIAAVVIGGTNILGDRGRYLGTLVGVVLIVLLNSVLSIMAMPGAGRQVI
jgi:ribose transport system permease protein